jgi:hypothetical protein
VPTFEQAVEAFAARHGWPLDKAAAELRRRIDAEVERALRGHAPRLDLVPDEGRQPAVDEFYSRLAGGEGAEGVAVFSGTTGARLA